MCLLYPRIQFDWETKFDIELKAPAVFVIGDAGAGKSYLYNQIWEYTRYRRSTGIVCCNRTTLPSEYPLENYLRNFRNKLIILDNADIIVPMDLRGKIAAGTTNQYLIFCHSTKGYAPAMNSIAQLRIENNFGRLEYLYEGLCNDLGLDPNRVGLR